MARWTAAFASLLLFLLLPRLFPPVAFADCVDYREYVRRVGGLTTYAYDVALSGDLAFVTEGDYNNTGGWYDFIKVINISNPPSPFVTGQIGIFGRAYGVAVSGSYLHVARKDKGLEIYDISDPTSPSLAGTLVLRDVFDVAASGSFAYILQRDLTNSTYLRVIDVSNPSSPSLVGSAQVGLSSQERYWGVEIYGSYAYVTGDILGIFDVSNPSSPAGVGSGPTSARAVQISGDYAFVADPNYGLRVLDITNPASSILTGSALVGGASAIAVSGNHAFLNAGGLQVVDVTNLSSPKLVGSLTEVSGKLAATSSHAYLADGYSFHVVEIINPTSPVLGIVEKSSGNYNDVAVSGLYAYATHSTSVFEVIDVSAPELPIILGSLSTPSPLGVCISGDRAYLTDAVGLRAIDVSNAASPFIMGSLSISGARSVAVSSPYAYVACYEGLKVVDIAASPSLVATVPVPEFPCYAVALSGSYAYVTGKSGFANTGLRVIDVSNPQLPTIAGGITIENTTLPSTDWEGISVEGSYAYIASSSGLQVVDISNAAAPFVAASLLMGGALDVAISGSYAYVNMGYPSRRIDVVDIREPLSPTLRATMGLRYPLNTTAGIVATSSYQYAVNNGALLISPLFCPGPCTPHLSNPNGGESYLAGAHTNVKWEYSPLQRCAVNHAQLHYSSDGGTTWDLVADVNGTSYVWRAPLVATQNGRLRVSVVDFSGVVGEDVSDAAFVVENPTGVGEGAPSVNRLYQNSPNPFQSDTQVMFDLAAKDNVALRVFDIKGAEVRLLAKGSYPAGRHEASWDARDGAGRPVAEGIYFLHLDAGLFSETKRMYVRR